MKIRFRLALWFTVLAATILLIFAAVIYFSAYNNREKEFYKLLEKEAITKANLFFIAKIDAADLQNIYRNNRQIINEAEVAIYDSAFHLLYHDAVDIDFVKENRQMLADILSKGIVKFYQQGWQVVGLTYWHKGIPYLMTAAAYDQHGYAKLENLQQSIILVFAAAILLIYGAGWHFARKALLPIATMTGQARMISATNLHLRLPVGRNRDELAELAATFNEMLERLENSFEAQKNFVSNISHELRTPLAAMIAELELSQAKERNADEYRLIMQNLLTDAQKLKRLISGLLDLAKAEYDPAQIAFKPLRIDETLFDARRELLQIHHNYRIDICFADEPETEEQLMREGNEYLLKVAFMNLMENACKFSMQKRCEVLLNFSSTHIQITFADEGIGIAPEDLPHIFKPFYRGANRSFATGNGIGLSLTQKIVHLHKGALEVRSEQGKGSRFLIVF